MIRVKVLVSICIGTLLYVLMSIIGGQNGIWAMKQLEEQKQAISIHTAEIEQTNDMLNLEYNALKKDMDVIASYAKRLGYVAEGEKLIKISGLAPYFEPIFDYGFVLKSKPVVYIPEWICKSCGFVFFILCFTLMLLKDVANRPYTKENEDKYVAGIKPSSFESIAGIKVETI